MREASWARSARQPRASTCSPAASRPPTSIAARFRACHRLRCSSDGAETTRLLLSTTYLRDRCSGSIVHNMEAIPGLSLYQLSCLCRIMMGQQSLDSQFTSTLCLCHIMRWQQSLDWYCTSNSASALFYRHCFTSHDVRLASLTAEMHHCSWSADSRIPSHHCPSKGARRCVLDQRGTGLASRRLPVRGAGRPPACALALVVDLMSWLCKHQAFLPAAW